MREISLLTLLMLASVFCYIDVDAHEARGGATGFRTLLFLKRVSPRYSTMQDRILPYGLQKRIDSEEKFSPFHSVLVVRRKKLGPAATISSLAQNADYTEAFLRDFLVSHLQNTAAAKKEKEAPKQFDTEKIYNDLYKHSRYLPKKVGAKDQKAQILGDEIDSIIASAAKELAVPIEEAREKEERGKRAKKGIQKKLKKAKHSMRKDVKINGVTVVLLVIIGVLSGYAGYCMKSRSISTEDYAPLSK